MKIGATIAIAAGLSVTPTAQGETLRVAGDRCSPIVSVAASNVPLSEVLRHLARALDFDLAFEAREDPSVTIDASRGAADLLLRLAGRANISIAQQRDSRCASGKRIVKVWILPGPDTLGQSIAVTGTRPLVSKAALASAQAVSDGNYWLITSEPSADEPARNELKRPTVFSTEEP